MDVSTLQIIWYIVFLFSIFAYAALDGFDIGVGCLHLFAKTDLDRRIFLNAIGPVWDGNTLWVIISIGSLLAGFPRAFATFLASLYVPMMFLVFGYIMRGAAIEFRGKMATLWWRSLWDIVFSVASFALAFGFGLVLAALIRGLPLDEEGILILGDGSLFSPLAILIGLFTTLLFTMHGGLFLFMKTEGELHTRISNWLQTIFMLFTFGWGFITILTIIFESQMIEIFRNHPGYLVVVMVTLLGIVLLPKLVSKGYAGWAFLSSFLIIASLVVTLALGTFPYLIRSTINTEMNSLTIYNASASPLTLKVLFIFGCIGVPLFILYLLYSYKVFKGKVKLDSMSY